MKKTALILVDLQNDFMPGGPLGVPEGDQVVPVTNALMDHFDLVVATQDFHPVDHGSFAANHPGKDPGEIVDLHGLDQILWPTHCVEGTNGAEFVPDLNQKPIRKIFRKGTDRTIDSYSGFFDNGKRKATGLGDYLKEQEVTDVFIMGLAADYCVKFTAIDAAQLNFKTFLITDGTRGVNLQPGDVDRALQEMQSAGVQLTTSEKLNLQEA